MRKLAVKWEMGNSTLSPIAIPCHLHSFPPFIPCNPFFTACPRAVIRGTSFLTSPAWGTHSLPGTYGAVQRQAKGDRGKTYACTQYTSASPVQLRGVPTTEQPRRAQGRIRRGPYTSGGGKGRRAGALKNALVSCQGSRRHTRRRLQPLLVSKAHDQ